MAELAGLGRVDVLVDNAATIYRVPHDDLDGLTDDAFPGARRGRTQPVPAWSGPGRTAMGRGGAVVGIGSIAGYRTGGSSIAYG